MSVSPPDPPLDGLAPDSASRSRRDAAYPADAAAAVSAADPQGYIDEPTDWMTPAGREETARIVIRAAAALVVATRQLDAWLDLEGLQGRILQLLRDRQPRSGSNLAEHAGVSSMAISKAVTALEQRGLVARYLCSEDRRMVRALITDQGAALVAELEAARAKDLGFLFAYQRRAQHLQLRQAAALMEELASRVRRFHVLGSF